MGKYVRRIALFLLLATGVYLVIRFYPVWEAAKYLHEKMDLARCSYEVEVELDRETLRGEQGKLLKVLAGVTGFGEEAMCRLTVRGSVWEDTIHAQIYPEGAESPLLELYLGNDADVINETLIYNAVRSHLAEQFQLLGLVMPKQDEALYMTLGQVEQMFGLDLERARNFSLPPEGGNISAGKYFIMLAFMGREQEGDISRFLLETEQLELEIEVPEREGPSSPAFRLHIEEPGEMDSKIAWILSQVGSPVPDGLLSVVKSFSVNVAPGGDEITMPTNFVNQDVVELITRIRELVMKLNGGSGEGAGRL